MRRSALSLYFFPFFLWLCCGVAGAQNAIQLENAKAGTAAWRLTAPSATPTVEGYASHTSINRGETIRFFVSSSAPSYTLAIYRMGWYGGNGGRLVHSVSLTGSKQATPAPDSVTGLVDCNWPESYRLTIPQTDWTSGIYLVKLTPSAGTQSYMIFVVRDDSSRSTYVYQSTPTTSQAYNNWGGKSLYTYNSSNGAPARKVSFNRPYALEGYWGGAGIFLSHEIYFVRFMEREGYDVTYLANLDLHTNGSLLLNHRAFLVAGHDEYWSYQMKAAAHAAQAQGVHLGFFTANEAYWQVRFEPSRGEANRIMVGYKEGAQSLDPLALDADRSNDKFITTRYRDLQPVFGVTDSVAQPENGLVGVMYHGDPFNGDIVVSDATNWVYNGTGVSNSSRFTGLLGYETDAIANNGYSPPQLRKVAESPDPWGVSHVATYTTTNGAIVFATGSMQWVYGLDNFNWENLESNAAKQVTRNVLARFAAAPLATPGNMRAAVAGQTVNLSWSASAGAASYNVFRSQTAGAQGYTPYRTGLASPSFSDTGLAAGSYFYKVTAANSATESAQSAEVAATVGTVVPPPSLATPLNLRASVASQTVSLNWSATVGATSYKIYRSQTAGGQGATAYRTGVTSPSFSDTGLAAGNYFYKVTAANGTTESARSAEVLATVGTVVTPPATDANGNPFPPTALAASLSGNFIKLTWVQSSSGAILTNKIWRATVGSGSYALVAEIPATTSYIDQSVVLARTYSYVVTAHNGARESDWSGNVVATAGSVVTPPPPPPPPPTTDANGNPFPPTALAASLSGNFIKLTWVQSSSGAILTNKIWRATAGSGSYALVAEIPATTSYIDQSVARAKTYSYVVTAHNGARESDWSSIVSLTTP